jgi:ketosteroid isomerase-like protein
MGAGENVDVVRRGFAAFGAGDMETLSALIADDAIWHVPGRSPISGDHVGKEAVFGLFAKLAEGTEMTMNLEIHDVTSSDDHVVVLSSITAGGSRGDLEVRAADTIHLSDGQLSEYWAFVDDTYAWDEYWS